MKEMKQGKLRSGRSGKKVTNPKQAIAIGLSEAREEGAKVPYKKTSKKKTIRKKVTAWQTYLSELSQRYKRILLSLINEFKFIEQYYAADSYKTLICLRKPQPEPDT